MHNNWRENLLFGDWVDLVNSDSCNLLSKLSFWSPFVHSLDNHDLWLQYAFEWIFKDHTISQLLLLTASSTSSPIIAAATPILFKYSTWSSMMVINGVTTTIVNGILSCLHSNARFIRGKGWKIRLFPKPFGEIAKTSILPTTCFKQFDFLCSSRLASTFGKSLSAVFVASSNSAWRRVCHHRHIAFLSVIEDAPLLTKTVKINQSEGIPGSGIPERTFVKNSYKRSRTSLPSPPLRLIAFYFALLSTIWTLGTGY